MFSTILDKATSYFDRRALVSSFFPSLVFWGLSVVAVIALQWNWETTLSAWDKLSGTLQFLLLFVFFVWVTFWSFLTSNFRMTYTRLFEGYWSDKKPFDTLLKWRCDYWQGQWKGLDKRRSELSNTSGRLKTEQDRHKERSKNLPAYQSTEQEPTASDIQELDTLVSRLESAKKEISSPSLHIENVQKLLHEVEDWRTKLHPWILQEKQKHESNIIGRDHQLRDFQKEFSQEYERQYAELEKQRTSLNRELSLYYPPESHDIMATRLGNVLRAIELYPAKRYHMDAVVIWPRLQPCLPDALSTTLQNSMTSLDLMVTLSAFMLLFGIPLTIWEAVKATTFFPLWLPLALALMALSRRLYLLAGLSALALILSLVNRNSPLLIMQIQMFLVGFVAVLFLFWLSYQNAIQAALDYGERIKSVFDLHRWRVLEELHLQLPTSLEEERRMWDAICGLLDRNYSPTTQVFSYAQQGLQFLSVPSTVSMPVAMKDLPAYHVIRPEDITQEQVSRTLIPVDAVLKKDDIIGKCTLKALSASQPISSALVVDPQRLRDTAAVGIHASFANVLGANLQAGDCIDVALVPPKIERKPLPQPVSFENLLVMDVKQADRSSKAGPTEGSLSFVIVLAVPINRKMDFLTMSTNGTVLLSRALMPTSVAQTNQPL